MGILVGIDVGELRIGLSICNQEKKIAFPFTVLKRENNSYCFNKMKKVLEGRDVEAFVVGLPVRSDGEHGPECEMVLKYVESLKKNFSQEVILWDERFTTVIAEKALLDVDMKREKRREVIDGIAAQILLQSYLDSLNTK